MLKQSIMLLPTLRQLFEELHSPLQRATVVYCDNISTVYLLINPVQHQSHQAFRD
jgi:hypothetical protein